MTHRTLDDIVAAHKHHTRQDNPMGLFADKKPPKSMSNEKPFTEPVELEGDPIRMNNFHFVVKTTDGRLLNAQYAEDDFNNNRWVWSDITPREDKNGNIINDA